MPGLPSAEMRSDSDSSPTGWSLSPDASRAATLVGTPQPSPPLRILKPDYLHKHRDAAQCSVCASSLAAVCKKAFEKSCEELGCGQEPSDFVSRLRPEHVLQPVAHFGLFGSGDTVMRSGRDRDEIAGQHGVIAFEMEGAGMWEILRAASCLIVKSVCDYSDSHKNKMFQGYAAAVAAATAKALLESWNAYVPNSLRAQRNKRRLLTAQEIRVLNKLKTVPYPDRKDRNPRRVPGTCEWFVGHKLFRQWLEGAEDRSKALWDDFADQKSAANAVCCILHQLFTQRPILFSDAIRAQLEAEPDRLTLPFRDLWDMFLKVADNPDVREILCILDALDECGAEDRSKLASAMLDLHRTKKAPNLKFLLTSRPYGSIRRSFQPPDAADLAVVHLSGENEAEMEQISKEIDIFIKARVQSIGARLMLDEEKQDLLQRSLLGVAHRTYLWVYLTLNLVEDDENVNKGKIRQAISKLPRPVDEAYEKILSASRDPDEARRALHIIVAAETPMTLGDMNFALELRPSHQSYEDVNLASDDWFRERLRDICGLFVTIIESKIYLLHQTAREFLVKADADHPPSEVSEEEQEKGKDKTEEGREAPKFKWKHSLEPCESHRILGEICVGNLQFRELHNDTASGDYIQLLRRIREFRFCEYSAFYWTVHLNAPHVRIDKQMTDAILAVIRACHRHRPFWFQATAKNYAGSNSNKHAWVYPSIADDPGSTPLMIAAYFGIAPAIEALIKSGTGGGLLARDSNGRTTLSWAAAYGHHDAAKVLIGSQPGVLKGLGWLGLWKPAIIEAADNLKNTPLMYAALSASESVTRLLLAKGADVEARNVHGATALWQVAGEPAGAGVVKLLLERGADIEARDDRNETALFEACLDRDADPARCLIENGADINSRNGSDGQTPLMAAIENNRRATIDLLLLHNADVHIRTKKGHTAFQMACQTGHLDLIKRLLDMGVDVESKDSFGMSALAEACVNGHEAVARVLIEHGADIESISNFGGTVLYYAWARGSHYASESTSVAELLLEHGVDVNARDSKGRSVLTAVAAFGNGPGVRWLLDHGAELESEDTEGRTPLIWAVAHVFSDKAIPALLQAGATVNARGRDGKSALSLATDKRVNHSVAKLLIDHGADVNAKDKEGRTPLALACGEMGNPQTAQVLREMGAQMD